ncbi:MAG: PilZ domain-containing protein [Tardiphaga sp.]|nr:PilZ domain-containing protein [Tardiphaga sp.]
MSVKEFFRQRAVNIMVGGSYELPNWLDQQGRARQFACRTTRVSPFRMIVAGPVIGRVGDSIRSYFGDFGKLDGRISDVTSGEFLMELAMTRDNRRKMANKLAWLENKQKDGSVKDARRRARIILPNPHSMLTFHDGVTRRCFIIDASETGVAVSADVQPEIGTPLAVGSCVGRVVRHLSDGFAVQFIEQQRSSALERRLNRAPSPRAMATGAPAQGREPTGA